MSQNQGTIVGIAIIRILVFESLHWGPLILGNYHARALFNKGVLGADPAGRLRYAAIRHKPTIVTSRHCNALVVIDQDGSVKALVQKGRAWASPPPNIQPL